MQGGLFKYSWFQKSNLNKILVSVNLIKCKLLLKRPVPSTYPKPECPKCPVLGWQLRNKSDKGVDLTEYFFSFDFFFWIRLESPLKVFSKYFLLLSPMDQSYPLTLFLRDIMGGWNLLLNTKVRVLEYCSWYTQEALSSCPPSWFMLYPMYQ